MKGYKDILKGFEIFKTEEEMIIKEHYSVAEVSKRYKISGRHIRYLCEKMKDETPKDLLEKDHNGSWRINNVILYRFKPKRNKEAKYYTLGIDPVQDYSEKDLHQIMEFVIKQVNDPNLEFSYTIEKKKANGRNHLHCFMNTKRSRAMIKSLNEGFSSISYEPPQPIYDLDNYKKYITKDGNKITTIKKN